MGEKSFVPAEFLVTNTHLLDEKKPQTTYKIEYFSNFVEKWLLVMSNMDEAKNINWQYRSSCTKNQQQLF